MTFTHLSDTADVTLTDFGIDGLRYSLQGKYLGPKGISLRSSNPLEPAVIRPNYLECDADFKVLIRGITLARELVGMPAFKDVRGDELAPGPAAVSEKELREYISRCVTTVFHPVGTCKMGLDRLAVVDGELRVRGVEGLRVADASIMPSIVSANTHAAVAGERREALLRRVAVAGGAERRTCQRLCPVSAGKSRNAVPAGPRSPMP